MVRDFIEETRLGFWLVLAFITCKELRVEKKARDAKVFLYIPKTIFDDEIKAIDSAGEDIRFIALRRRYLIRAMKPLMLAGYSEYSYLTEEEAKSNRTTRVGRRQMRVLLRLLRYRYRAIGIVTGAYYYVEQRELAKAATDIGFEFICLHKESITTPISRYAREIVLKRGSKEFYGSLLMTYNEEEMETIKRASEGKEFKTFVTGSPRLDALFTQKASETYRFDVVFFMFTENTYLPVYRGKLMWKEIADEGYYTGEAWTWKKTLEEYISAIKRLVVERKDLRICVKVKQGAEIDKQLKGLSKLHDNLQIVDGGSGYRLIRSSRVTVAFNSTALVEAIAANSAVATLGFGEADEKKASGQLGVLQTLNAVPKAASGDELVEMIEDMLRQNVDEERWASDRERVLKRYIGTARPDAAIRVYNILKNI